MALITDGILRQKLPWGLVLLGVSIALVLELCGIPSLAFAVGVYLPMSASTPILAGGLVRYGVERWRRPPTTPDGTPSPPSDEETSPGSLLSTGYIAGGAIAGVIIAFLSFSDAIPRQMAVWQYRTYSTQDDSKSPGDAATEAAKSQLGIQGDVPEERKEEVKDLTDEIKELNEDLVPRFWPVPKGFELKLPKGEKYSPPAATTLGEVATEKLGSAGKAQLLLTLNLDRLVLVENGKKLTLPRSKTPKDDEELIAVWNKDSKRFVVKEKTAEVTEDAPLGEVAKKLLGKEERAQELYDLNDDDLQPEIRVPKGVALKIPQAIWPALAAFGVLILILGLVGTGYLFRESNGPNNGANPTV